VEDRPEGSTLAQQEEDTMKHTIGFLACSLLLFGLSGCMALHAPHAKAFAEKAKGTTQVETLENLATMMETSATAAKGRKGDDQALEDLHDQSHAFRNVLYRLDKTKRETPAYALTVTHTKELKAIFKRIKEFKDFQLQRDQHLDLFLTKLRETRDSLQALK
jgi:hypothetical protein